MIKNPRDTTKEYRAAEKSAKAFNPGEQPDIAALMRSAYTHGYAQAMIDLRQAFCEPDSSGLQI